ncbi:4-hydroxy-tetrahydrodipicolinate reductase [bacterium]|nr:MAG: 4-hydroxy-tetrahydrodipicolinate reductase [bacterium]
MNDKLPKIALVGYGAMGRVIEKLAKDKGYFITDIFDNDKPLDPNADYDFDVAIDFTQPDIVLDNIKILSSKGKRIVVGTTGWYDKSDEVSKIITKNENAMVWGSNFSVGVQMYFKIVKYASKLVNYLDSYDVMVTEMHHKRKKDSPSGTAEIMGKIITSNINRKTGVEYGVINGDIDNSKLHITSTRGGEVTGTHTMYLDSLADTIELTHRAKNRTGFALGSLLAANWVQDKKGYYSFNEILTDIWENIPE